MIIYKITNKINNKAYIGQTSRPIQKRINEHKSKNSSSIALSNAIRKYGIENFSIEKISEASSLEELNKKEIEFIKEFNTLSPNGYNLTEGGNCGIFSEESRLKLSVSNSGEKHRMFGKHHSVETRKKMSKASKGKLKSESHKIALRMSEDVSKRKKPIICNETLKKYDSLADAARDIGVKTCSVWSMLKGKLKHVKGLTFSYL